MIIRDDSIKNLNLKGIYSITSKDGKRYIGHAKKTFIGRFKTHFEKLRSNNHPNRHLQNAWNLYKIENFEFEVIEVLQENDCFECREKYWIEYFESWNRDKGYNINRNPEKSPSLTKEVKNLISSTLKRKHKEGLIKVNIDTLIKKGTIPWNKGKKYISTNHLKVPKKNKGSRLNDIETKRNNCPNILVYKDSNFLGEWRSSKDLEEDSLKTDFKLKSNMILRNKEGRNNYSPFLLKSSNINYSCKTGKPYKGLNFKFHAPQISNNL